MKNVTIILALVFTIILNFGCRDNSPKPASLPYFYCKIDGKEFNPKYETDFGYRSIDARLEFNETSLLVSADGGDQSFGILVSDSLSVKTNSFILQLNSSMNSGFYDDNTFDLFGYFITDSVNLGTATITKLDKTKKIVEGTFSFIAYNSTKNKFVHVTEGKFRAFLRP